jgi:hypothetical protein
MERHPDTALIASFGPFNLIANKYAGVKDPEKEKHSERLASALKLCLRELEGMHSALHPTCEGGCPLDEAATVARAALKG